MTDEPALLESPFAMMGASEELVHRLSRSFYAHMARTEPELAATHQLDAAGLIVERSQENFALFLIEWLGGPARYTPTHGHPRLRRRHAHVAIDSRMRDAWLRCMALALDEVGVMGDVRDFLDARFADVANFLRNTEG